MSGFELLRPALRELLEEKWHKALNPLQVSCITRLKSGNNLIIESDEGTGKTSAVLVSILQKIEQAAEGSPRAIVICKHDDQARLMHTELANLAKFYDLTVDLAHEKGNMLQQRNDICDGTEIIIGTPKRIHDLYIQNGFNVSKLKLFVIDDIQDQMKKGHCAQLKRMAESLPKCQFVLTSHSFADKRVQEFIEEFMPAHQKIEGEA